MDATILKQIIVQQNDNYANSSWADRTIFDKVKKTPDVVVLSGVRRCGKSTLLQQIRSSNKEKNYYLNFDDERLLYFTKDDFQMLYEMFIELYGEQNTFYFDEIQNIPHWEFFIRRLHNANKKIFITGSNANLLSRELGTQLTGRHIQLELFPFSFKEFLNFRKFDFTEKDFYTTKGRAMLNRLANEYFLLGGFPAYLQNKQEEYLKSLYESVLYRDIMIRNKITNENEIRELGYYIVSNIAKPFSLNSLKNIIQVKHVNTVKSYLSNFESSYLIFKINKYDYSLKKQLINPQKVYFIDNALAQTISFKFSEERGRYLENVIFLELRRRFENIFYHKEKCECDFIVTERGKVFLAVQVCVSLKNENTKQRELNGLQEAMETYKLKKGFIVTENEEAEIKLKQKQISVVPYWKFLLQENFK